MTRKITPITPVVNGYAVAIAQEQSVGGMPGAFIGCFLQTPESPEDGELILLHEAMAKYIKHTNAAQYLTA
jgi:hypothetical protein